MTTQPPSGSWWTESEINDLRARKAKGQSNALVARKMGRSVQSIRAAIKRYCGVDPEEACGLWPKAARDRLTELHDRGLGNVAIANDMGRRVCDIKAALIRFELVKKIDPAGYRWWAIRDAIKRAGSCPECMLIAGHVADANHGTKWGDDLRADLRRKMEARA